jgi:formate dehydrogenase major subunit
MTSRTKNNELRPTDLLCISPNDAKKLNILDGEVVKVKSRYGEITLPININSLVKKGELFSTFHTPKIFLNRLTSSHRI